MAQDVSKERLYESYWEQPINVLREIEAGEKERDRNINNLAEALRRYEGPGRGHPGDGEWDPYNFAFEWQSLVRPQIAFQNPVVRIRSKRPEFNGVQAVALQHWTNRWIRDTHYIRTIERATTYMGFTHAATMTTLEPDQGDYDDPRSRPRKIVMDPSQFGMDALARSWEESRIFFHRCVEDRYSLLKRAEAEDGWDMDAVRRLPIFGEGEKVGRPKSDLDRGEVSYYWVWVPGDEDESSDTHGMVMHVAFEHTHTGDKKPCFLRDPMPYFGPRWGPYTLWDFYFVPRSPWPMGPIQAQHGLSKMLNAQARVNMRRAKNRKDLFLFDDTDREAANRIFEAQDGSGVGIPGYDKSKVQKESIGGVNEDELAYEQWIDGLLKRSSGISGSELGNTGGGQTATSDAIAAGGSSARKSFLEQKVYDAVRRDVMTAAYFGWKEKTIVMPLGPDYLRELVQAGLPPEYVQQLENMGGVTLEWRGGEKQSFDDLELEIEPYSMARRDEFTERSEKLQLFQLLTTIAPVIPQTPWMPWKDMLNKIGDSFHYDQLGERTNIELANEVGSMMLQLEASSMQEKAAPESPRMSSDVSPSAGGAVGSRMTRPSELGKSKNAGGLQGKTSGAKLGASQRK